MTYTNFDQLLDAPTVNNDDRLKFTRKWLADSYEITDPTPEFVNSLSDVHNHDNLPKHYGQVRVGSSFSAFIFQLVRLPEGWHLGAQNANKEQGSVIHPKNEQSYRNPDNQKLRLQARQLLNTGKTTEVAPTQTFTEPQAFNVDYTEPQQTFTADDIYAAEDKKAAKNSDELHPAAITPLTDVKTTSVSIDLGSF